MAVVYNWIPTRERWRADSSVWHATRANDQILCRIDELLAAYHEAHDDGARLYIAADLFFTLDYWLKVYKTTSGMASAREPAVMELYRCVVDVLGTELGAVPYGGSNKKIEANNLPAALETFFGRTMSARGAMLDLRLNCADYLDRADVQKYKLMFKGGKAYQLAWFRSGRRAKSLVLADSAYSEDRDIFGVAGWCGFAMSMGRDLYMAPHFNQGDFGGKANFYHSSYLAGEAVLCAGTIRIENGIITGIATDSGHYRPSTLHVVNVLQALQMHGINLATITVENHDHLFRVNAVTFLSTNGNWARAIARQKGNIDHMESRRVDEKAFGDALKQMWEQGLNDGFYRNDIQSKLFFFDHVLRLSDKITVNGVDFHTSGLNFLYALDAMAKATSRAADPNADWDEYMLREWRAYLKGDTAAGAARRDGAKNTKADIPAFAAWIKAKYPVDYARWTPVGLAAAIQRALSKKGHRFDDDEVSEAAKKLRANAPKAARA